ncbi:MAG TPA: hypothetical protein PLW50_00575 [Smithellaceae bacterium]|nr:hypothetical protein [Smithellaceae bacterium]
MVDYMPEGTNTRPTGAVEPGMYITPVYSAGYSPLTVTFVIIASPGSGEQIVTEYALKCDDGTIVKGNFKSFCGGLAMETVQHTYEFAQGTSKYYGHTFYPDVTIQTKAGAVKTMNHNGQKACSVYVKDPAYTKDTSDPK